MDIEEFVSEAIAQTMRGIRKAQDSTKELGSFIVPAHEDRDIDFDIAVIATDTVSGSSGLSVVGMAKGDIGMTRTEGSVSRIRFSVQVIFPQPKN